MYFSVKYIDYKAFERTEDIELDRTEITDDLNSVFPVENKEILVNPDCFIGIILDYIYSEVGIDEEIKGDFNMSSEKGKLLNVHDFPLDYNGLNIFTEGCTYYIVQTSKDEVKVLLSKLSNEYWDFIDSRRKRSSVKKRRSGGSKPSSKGSVNSSTVGKAKRSSKASKSKLLQ